MTAQLRAVLFCLGASLLAGCASPNSGDLDRGADGVSDGRSVEGVARDGRVDRALSPDVRADAVIADSAADGTLDVASDMARADGAPVVDVSDAKAPDSGPAVVCGGNYHVTSYAALGQLSTCTEISGFLLIDDEKNFDATGNYVGGGSDPVDIVDLAPLGKLTSIGGKLLIPRAVALKNVDGLASLRRVGGSLEIDNADKLQNLDGLSALTTVGAHLYLTDNDALAHLRGLAAITSIGGPLYIFRNDALKDIDTLDKLVTLNGWLSISENAGLTMVSGLSALSAVSGYLAFADNPTLRRVKGLSALKRTTGFVSIVRNAVLDDISGLFAIATVGADLLIRGNPKLPQCHIAPWLATLSVAASKTVQDTDTNVICP